MTVSNFLDRFKIHLNSFQEGFDVLADSNSLKELAKQFCHIVRGNLFVKGVALYFNQNNTEKWAELYNLNFSNKFELSGLNNYKNTLNVVDNFPSEGNILMTLPMIDNSSFAVLLDNKLTNESFNELDKLTFQLFTILLNNAYQSYLNRKKEKQLIFKLNHRVLQLNSLIDTGIEVTKLNQNESLFELALQRAASLTNASEAVLRVKAKSGKAKNYYFPSKFDIDNSNDSDYKISAQFNFQNVDYLFILLNKESRYGYLPFEETDRLLLDAFGRQVLSAIEIRFLHQEEIEKQKIQQELSVAGSIQKKIIPDKLPEIDGYDIAGINIPSKEVGGDYYDCKKLEDGRYALIIADVTGKGVPASLLVSSLNAALNVYLESNNPLTEIAFKLNKLIFNATPPDKYITFFIALLSPETGELEIVNAGHNPIYHLNIKNEIRELSKGGLAFGMMDMDLPFENDKLIIQPGEKLLLYTDGIPEAMNEMEEVYEDETLINFFQNKNFESAQEFINNLMIDIKRHTGNTPQSDDITALYLTRI